MSESRAASELATGREYALVDFKAYLHALNLSPTTIMIYLRIVRGALKRMPNTREEGVRAYQDQTTEVNFVSAWSHFAVFARAKNYDVASVRATRKRHVLSIEVPLYDHPMARDVIAFARFALTCLYDLATPLYLNCFWHDGARENLKLFGQHSRSKNLEGAYDTYKRDWDEDIGAFRRLVTWGWGVEDFRDLKREETYDQMSLFVAQPKSLIALTATQVAGLALKYRDFRTYNKLLATVRAEQQLAMMEASSQASTE